MKKFFTLLCLFIQLSCLESQTILFSQNFATSSTVSDYVNASNPSTNQFNAISTSGSGTVISINSGKLQFARTANAGSFSRTTDFASPDRLFVQFKLSVTGNSATQTNAGALYIGANFDATNSPPSNANSYARLGINFTTTNGTWSLRDVAGSSSSNNVSGEQTITWVMNNSGGSIDYNAPDGTVVALPDDKIDIWIGSTKVFNNVNPTTATQSITDIKFVYSTGTGTVTFDDIVILTASGSTPLPVELTAFNAKSENNQSLLTWQTASEKENAYFGIEHSTNATHFREIAQVKGNGTTAQTTDYQYVHTTPSVGANYYRLRQVDFNGSITHSPIRSVWVNGKGKISLFPTVSQHEITLRTNDNDLTHKYEIYNMLGERVLFGEMQGEKIIAVSTLSRGVYVLKINGENLKFVKE